MPDDRRDDRKAADEALEQSTQKWMFVGLILMGLFVLAFPLFRFYEPAQRADAREAQSSFFAAEGAELFEVSCSECHGPSGSGAIAPAIGSSEFLASVDDDQITQLTALGVPGTEMVAYSNDYGGPMTQTEIRSITTYLRSLEEEAPSIANWRAPLMGSDFGAAELYSLACSRCHGVDREGIDDVAPDLSEDSLTMLESDDWIEGRVAEGYKDMPRFNTVLTPVQIAAIVGYLRTGTNQQPGTVTTTTTTPSDATSGDAGATTTTAPAVDRTPDNDEVLALGEALYTETFSFDGCQECHGLDLNGTADGPSIIGASRSSIARALQGVPDMEVETPLTNEEIEAVYQYITWLFSGSAPGDSDAASTESRQDAAPSEEAAPSDEDTLALGREIWVSRVLGDEITGCQECHGRDGLGGPDAPRVTDASLRGIVDALNGGVIDMNFDPPLTETEIEAVYAYIQTLEG